VETRIDRRVGARHALLASPVDKQLSRSFGSGELPAEMTRRIRFVRFPAVAPGRWPIGSCAAPIAFRSSSRSVDRRWIGYRRPWRSTSRRSASDNLRVIRDPTKPVCQERIDGREPAQQEGERLVVVARSGSASGLEDGGLAPSVWLHEEGRSERRSSLVDDVHGPIMSPIASGLRSTATSDRASIPGALPLVVPKQKRRDAVRCGGAGVASR
jgi:hypothetical protein